jgi:uncharacterized membrane protein YeiH
MTFFYELAGMFCLSYASTAFYQANQPKIHINYSFILPFLYAFGGGITSWLLLNGNTLGAISVFQLLAIIAGVYMAKFSKFQFSFGMETVGMSIFATLLPISNLDSNNYYKILISAVLGAFGGGMLRDIFLGGPLAILNEKLFALCCVILAIFSIVIPLEIQYKIPLSISILILIRKILTK